MFWLHRTDMATQIILNSPLIYVYITAYASEYEDWAIGQDFKVHHRPQSRTQSHRWVALGTRLHRPYNTII